MGTQRMNIGSLPTRRRENLSEHTPKQLGMARSNQRKGSVSSIGSWILRIAGKQGADFCRACGCISMDNIIGLRPRLCLLGDRLRLLGRAQPEEAPPGLRWRPLSGCTSARFSLLCLLAWERWRYCTSLSCSGASYLDSLPMMGLYVPRWMLLGVAWRRGFPRSCRCSPAAL